MASLEVKDPLLCSDGGSSNKRKRIAEDEQPEIPSNSNEPRPRSKGPRVKLVPFDRFANKRRKAECVEIALSFWNKKSVSKKGPEYELVEALSCFQVAMPLIYHCNFTARPKNDSEAENKLFFAEVMGKIEKDGKTVARFCTNCCILGPNGTETGLRGCKICSLDDHVVLVQHPKNGGFKKKRGI